MIYTQRSDNLIIKKPDCDRDYAAITLNYRKFKDEFLVDAWNVSEDIFLKLFLENESSRVIKLGDDYIAFSMLEGFTENQRAFLHGYPNRIGKEFKVSNKSIIQGARARAIEHLCLHYFDCYKDHTSKHLDIIEIELPEFIHLNSNRQLTTWSKAILDAGFTLLNTKPRKFSERKNGRPVSTYLFQLGEDWFRTWLKIEQEYMQGVDIQELASKYRKKPEQIQNRLQKKRIV